MKEYLDFDLEIREGGPREYPVVVDSPGGQAQGQMHFPFDDWELENKLLALENALLRSGGSQRSISPDERTVQEFGERLFKAVLTGDIRTRYEVSLRVARQQNKGLRLKLHIQPPKLALLPWEFLYDPDSGEYLCFSSSTPLVRYVDLSRPIEQLPVTPPLRILGMVASPTDLPQLDVDKEKRLVEEAIKVLREKGLVELTWLEEQTWSALQEEMWGGPWHIFHFVGHGDFDRNNGEGRVAFSDEAGHQVILPARNLARLLDDHRDLRLTFLNSCEGARSGEGDPFSGTAATLVRRGVPAVLAMQYQITDKAAIAFSRAFYHAVANNLPVDAAVAAARTAVSMYDTLEWGTPVLYMRSPDGRLFDIKKEETVEKESFRRYREYVQTSWTHGELREKEAKELKESANELKLPPSAAADIESEVMGETKEAILERREQAVKENYRKAVEAAWTDHDLSNAEAAQLHALSTELDLSPNAAADIERKFMDDTVEAIIQRQTGEEERRQRHLKELYDRARRSHQNQEWEAVGDVFEQIHSEDQNYPDPEGLLASSSDALEQEQRAAALYDRGQRHIKTEEWQQALECFEEIQRLVPDYRETGELLSRVRRELARPPKVKIPDLSGQEISRASSVLANSGLNLGAQNKVANNTIPEGQIIEQSLRPGTEVEAGSSVSITVSSGAQKASRRTPPDHQVGGLTDRTERARSLLLALTGSWWAMALRGLVIVSFGLAGLVLQEGAFQFRLSYALMIIADGAIAYIDGATRVDHRRLLLIQGGTSIVVGLLVLVVWLVNIPLISNYAYTVRDIFHHFAVAPRLIGSWAILIGITRIIAAPQLMWDTKNLWLMGTSGVSLFVFGIPLLLRVDPTWRPLSFLLLVSGVALIAVALRARDR